MSSVIISGDTSGAITLSAPAVAGTNTITLPAAAGTVQVSGNMPAFSAIITAATQSISPNTYTKVQLGTELFDTNNNFDSTTNYRFTPTIAGYYQINASVAISYGSAAPTGAIGQLYKNGSVYYQTSLRNDAGNQMYGNCSINTLVYLNGSTDYLELWGYSVGGTGTVFIGTQAAGPSNISTWMNGSLVRTA